mgnify:CR=1 FL=1
MQLYCLATEAKYTGEITAENYVVNQKFHHHHIVAPRWQSASKDIAQLEYLIDTVCCLCVTEKTCRVTISLRSIVPLCSEIFERGSMYQMMSLW